MAGWNADATFTGPRRRMVESVERAGVRDPRVLAALSRVPRHRLVPEALGHQAYRNCALPIGAGQTISAPQIVAVMTEALGLRGDETVLEVGTGSAYQAAVLSELAARVISVERVPALVRRARGRLDVLGISNVIVHLGDGSRGRPAEAPFGAVLVTAGAPEVPRPLLEQLAPGGRLVGPFGPRARQSLLRIRRTADGKFAREVLGKCRFVDLVGEFGWVA